MWYVSRWQWLPLEDCSSCGICLTEGQGGAYSRFCHRGLLWDSEVQWQHVPQEPLDSPAGGLNCRAMEGTPSMTSVFRFKADTRQSAHSFSTFTDFLSYLCCNSLSICVLPGQPNSSAPHWDSSIPCLTMDKHWWWYSFSSSLYLASATQEHLASSREASMSAFVQVQVFLCLEAFWPQFLTVALGHYQLLRCHHCHLQVLE